MLYCPKMFAEDDAERLHAFMRSYGFATLISPHENDPLVTHLPLLFDAERGLRGTLIGHVARANRHWQHLEQRPTALAIFNGPHSYISPSWYQEHPSVPTWNYAVVHAHGHARIVQEPQRLEAIVRRLVSEYEDSRAKPWRMALPQSYQESMLANIVGIEIEVTELEGKFKLSQNRSATDRSHVIEALAGGAPEEAAVAALMRSRSS